MIRSLRNKIIIILVLITMALCAAFIGVFCCSTQTPMTAHATSTPIYTVTFDYSARYYHAKTDETISTRSGTATKISPNDQSSFGTFQITLTGSNTTASTATLNNPAYINFSDLYFKITPYYKNAASIMMQIDEYKNGSLQRRSVSFDEDYYTYGGSSWADGDYTLKTYSTYSVFSDYMVSSGWDYKYEVSATTSFIVDTTSPTVNFSCGDDGFSNGTVLVTYSDLYGIASATYSRSTSGSFPASATTSFNSGTTFSEEGNYTVKVTDKAGNITTKHFTIDKTAPTLTPSCGNNGFTNGTVTATWTTGTTYVTSNRSNSNDELTVLYSYNTTGSFPSSASTTYTSGTSLTTAGNYLMIISDKAGNSTSYTFTIDKTAPTLTLSGVSSGGFTNGAVTATWETDYGSVAAQRSNSNDLLTVKYTYNTTGSFPSNASTTYTLGASLTTAGNYLMIISDKAGNSTSYTFTIDKTAPTLTLSGVSNGGFTNGAVTATWSTGTTYVTSNRSNSNDELTVLYSYNTTGSFPSSVSTTYTSGTSLTTAGNYLMIISDKAGNSTSYTFTIDKSAPLLSLSCGNEGFTNGAVTATWETDYGSVAAQRSNSNDVLTVLYSYNTTGSFPSSASTTYSLNTPLTEPGNYYIRISDKAGNSTSYTFTIDKSAPTLTLTTSDNSAFVNNRTKANVSATWSTTANGVTSQRSNSNDVLTVLYSCSATGGFPTSAESIYASGDTLNTEGKYLLIIRDRAGNVSEYYFEIYRQAPTFTILSESGAELYSEYNAFNVNIKLIFSAELTAQLNSRAYTSGTLIEEEGEYTFVLTDELGNRTTETIYIIKTPPTTNFNLLRTSINRWYETSSQSGQMLSFATYDNAYKIADARERALIKTGIWKDATWDGGINIAPDDLSIAAQGMSYYIYKSYSNASENHAYFSLATLNKAIEKYASSSVVTRYTPGTPATEAEGEVVYRDIYYSKSAISFVAIKNCSIYVDSIKQAYPYTLTAPGLHTIYEVDIAGNSVTYQVYVDTAQPIVRVTNLNGNLPKVLTYGETAYFTYAIRIYLDDADEQALLKINDDYYIGGTVELRAAGIYTITTRDAAGNTGNLTIYISLIEPTIEFTETEVAGVINSFDITVNKNYTLNNIISLGIYKWNDEGGTWAQLERDNSSYPVLIDNRTLSYTFNVTGKYRIIIIDAFGRRLEEEYNFIKGSPKGTLATSTNEVLPNGAYVRSSVYFTWVLALDCRAEISVNGGEATAYERGTFISAEGEYAIKLISNTDDNYNLYTFTIDKTPPVGTLMANGEELKNGATTRYSVSLNWTEQGCTATFNGQPYPSGTEISESGSYTIILTDRAGNKSTYTFRIKTNPPAISIIAGSTTLQNYGITKNDVYITWSESNCTCLVNGSPYTANTKIRIEGSYSVVLIDAYGNSATVYFTIDKTPPVGTLEVDGKPIEDNNITTNKKVALTWTESGCTAVINRNFVYLSGTQIKEDGTYTIVLSDAAGNSTSYTFTIKTTPPKATLFANNEEVESGSATRYNVRLTWTESGCTATLNGLPYSKGTTISAEGTYTFIVSDSYGNSGTWEITIDKTPPEISIISDGVYLSDGAITRYNTYVMWDDLEASATLNGKPVNNGECIEDEGEFTLIVTDRVGNRSLQLFIIDKTAKIGTVVSNTKILSEGDITRYNAYFTWTESGCTATLNGLPYSKGTTIKDDGFYTIVLTDKAGNTSTYTFTIDKTPPIGTLYVFKDETYTDAGENPATSGSLVFIWDEEGCTATLNGAEYASGTEVSMEGEYTFILTDAAGNTSIYTATIDKTPPEISVFTNEGERLENGAETRYNIYFTWTEKNCTATLNGLPYNKETTIRETGEYTLILTDAVGNISTITISVYKLLPTADIIPIDEGFVLPYLNNGFVATWDDEGCTATLNGQPYEKGAEVTEEGEYQFVITNRVGLSTVYEIIIDRTAPTAQIFTADGSAMEVTEDFAIKSIYFTWTEQGCTATLNGKSYTKGAYITTSGDYRFILTDKAGNSAIYQILITKEKPIILFIDTETLTEIPAGGSTTKEFQVIMVNESDTITLNGEIFDPATPLSEVGEYTFVVTNRYGNSAEYTITVKDPTTASASSSTGMPQLLKGSATGTTIFFSVIAILAGGIIVVLVIRKVRGGGFKRKLK